MASDFSVGLCVCFLQMFVPRAGRAIAMICPPTVASTPGCDLLWAILLMGTEPGIDSLAHVSINGAIEYFAAFSRNESRM